MNIERRQFDLLNFELLFTGASCEFTGFTNNWNSGLSDTDFGLSGKGQLHNDSWCNNEFTVSTMIAYMSLSCTALPQCQTND